MHKNILSENQIAMLPLIKQFSSDYYLVGGTALALQYGHRRSLDFDLFTIKSFETQSIIRAIRKNHEINQIHIDEPNQLTLVANHVKMTFYQYEYPVIHHEKLEDVITLPDDLIYRCYESFCLSGAGPNGKTMLIYSLSSSIILYKKLWTGLMNIMEKASLATNFSADSWISIRI